MLWATWAHAQADDTRYSAEIKRTGYGVPHITANSQGSLAYGLAYAYARDNICQLAEKFVQLNGELAKHFGPDKLTVLGAGPALNTKAVDSDFFNKLTFDRAAVRAVWEGASAETREMARGYAAGYNRYLRDTGAANLPAACRNAAWVRPIGTDDLYMLYSSLVTLAGSPQFAQAFLDATPPAVRTSAAGGDAPALAAAAPAMAPRELLAQAGLALAEPNPTLEGLGSNAWAFGRETTANGGALLLQNSHWTWSSTAAFYQAHLTIPGQFDAMGVTIGASPTLLYGFTKTLAWALTVSTGPRFIIRELALGADPTTYVVDGVTKPMSQQTLTVEVRGAPTQTRTFYRTEFGPVLKYRHLGLDWTASKAYAFTDINLPNNRVWENALALAKAPNAEAARQAHGHILGYPLVNVLMIDSGGDAVYTDYSVKPYLDDAKLAACALPGAGQVNTAGGRPVIDGSRSACNPDTAPGARQSGILPMDKLPFLRRSDYLVNANNTYWLANPAAPMTGLPVINGAPATDLGLRARMNLITVQDRLAGRDGLPGKQVSPDVVQAMLASNAAGARAGNRGLAAELMLPATLASVCAGSPEVALSGGSTVNIAEACAVLGRWDQRYNPESVGAVTFREYFRLASALGASLWRVPFDAADPVHTPREPNVGNPEVLAKLRQALGGAVQTLRAAGVPMDLPWGQALYTTARGKKLAASGGSNLEGLANVMEGKTAAPAVPPLTANGYPDVNYGASWVGTVSFDRDGPVAHGVLVYGQSSDPDSPHYFDQHEALWSKRLWPRVPFTPAQIAADPHLTVQRIGE